MRRWPHGLLFLVAVLVVAGCSDDAASPPDEGVVRGEVLHTYTGAPLAGITVEVDEQTTTTAGDGSFLFAHVEQGDQVLQAWSDDYQRHQRAITVQENQFYPIHLSPNDTLVTLNGHVFHADDGDLDVELTVDGRTVESDQDGRWSLDDVPMGPVTITVDESPYRPYEERITVFEEGQQVDVRLRREINYAIEVDHDSYVFTESDSLNANRGQFVSLWTSNDRGRRAYFLFPDLGNLLDDVELVSASLELHGNMRIDPGYGWEGETSVPVTLWWLTESFYENSVDFYMRPAADLGASISVNVTVGILDQPFSIDITSALSRTIPYEGLAFSITEGHLGLGVASSEYGDEGTPEALVRPRVRLVIAD